MKDEIKITNENGKYIISYLDYDIELNDMVIKDNHIFCYYDEEDKGFKVKTDTDFGQLLLNYLEEEVEIKDDISNELDLSTNDLLYFHLNTCIDLLSQYYLDNEDRTECKNRMIIIKEMIKLFY